jgi:DDE superfamily endonuclease/Helix-turn-helix of DDE superfamily endonuclease
MISLALARRSDRLMKAATSLTRAEFDALARQFAPLWDGRLARQTATGTPRQRQPGGGRKSILATAQAKLFFILFYYKAYPTQDLMGLLFGFTQGQVSSWVGRLTPAVSTLMDLHKPVRRVRALHELLARDPALQEVIIDGTERRLPRPVRADRQRRYYSGRKKRHGVKNVIVTARGKVRWLSRTRPARRHDKAVAEEDRLRLPAGVTLLGDSGFAGLDPGGAMLLVP